MTMRYLLLATLAFLVGCFTDTSTSERAIHDHLIPETAIVIQATNVTADKHYDSLNTYVDEGFVLMVYPPDGRGLGFSDCFIDTDLNGECVDVRDNTWIFEGPASPDNKNGDGAEDSPPTP